MPKRRTKNSDLPEGLRVYNHYGMDIAWASGAKDAFSTCPWCNGEKKFSIRAETGQSRCLKCGHAPEGSNGMNSSTFLEELYKLAQEQTSTKALATFAKQRELKAAALLKWGAALSPISGEWLVPSYNVSGALCNLSRYVKTPKGSKLMGGPGLGSHLFGIPLLSPEADTVYVCEGPWDGMALWSALRMSKWSGEDLVEATDGECLLNRCSVVSVPGCSMMMEAWLPLFDGKHVIFLFDNDHPSGTKPGAALEGLQRVCGVVARTAGDVSYLHWGEDETYHTPDLPDGADIRDWFAGLGSDNATRANLGVLLGRLRPAPEPWRKPRKGGTQSHPEGKPDVRCEDWKGLTKTWRKAMKWTEGLDTALSVMLASVISTRSKGDQLWFKIMGPPGCVAGTTELGYAVRCRKTGRIINHKGGSIQKLYRRITDPTFDPRCNRDVDYLIQSVTDEGTVVRVPIRRVVYSGEKLVWRLTTASGRRLEATPDHEILTNDRYVKLEDLKPGDSVVINPGTVRSKGGRSKGVYRKEVTAKHHPRARTHYVTNESGEYPYQLIREYWAVYEADKNGMSTEEYLDKMNGLPEDAAGLWTIPEGYEIHHKDEDFTNNRLSNLELVRSQDHQRDYHLDRSKQNIAILAELEEVVSIEPVGTVPTYDIQCYAPYHNFVANGIAVHNCGKTSLCEAVSYNTNYCYSKSTIRGFHSGWKSKEDKGRDISLLASVINKTLVTKDGDTLLSSPNLGQILSEARDIYDGVSRTHYRTGAGRDYSGIRMTWLLCGTSGLRSLDSSELGERFLDCIIMEGIDEELEDEILWRAANRAYKNLGIQVGKDADQHDDETVLLAKRTTSGYITYLRENAEKILKQITMEPEDIKRCIALGKMVAYMRARPSTLQTETAEREFGSRLAIQFVRLAGCLAGVLGETKITKDVMRRVHKVAVDTSRGQTMQIAIQLYRKQSLEPRPLALLAGVQDSQCRKLLRFMEDIGMVSCSRKGRTPKYRLTQSVRSLCDISRKIKEECS